MTTMAEHGPAASPPMNAEAGPGRPPGSRPEAVASVTDSFIDLQRTVRQSKARLLAAAGNDVESATHLLLHTVESEGPMRASALAASVHADLSTVSRQVAALVGRGLLERRADQRDGRACVLAVTDAGRAAIAEHERGRQAFFDEVLAGWSADELRQFGQQMERFTAAYDRVHAARVGARARHPDARQEVPSQQNSTTAETLKGTNA
jgi:DNA-binding MarR family transcriptional regulator